MRTYHHLQLSEREKIFAWKESGVTLQEISRRLGRNVGTISREWQRHTRYGKAYLPCLAQRQADRSGQRQRYQAPLKCPLVWLYVREHLRKPYFWSPETIAGRLPLDYPGYSVDDETIYRYVYARKQRKEKFWKFLTLHRRRRLSLNGRKVTTRGRIPKLIPIENRPVEVMARTYLGHWESDNLEGKRSDQTGISVTVERTLRLTRLVKLQDHRALTKAVMVATGLSQEDPGLMGTLTLDRGLENYFHQLVTFATGIQVYFANAYHSWEKGTVENTIGRIRRFIPKGRTVDDISEEYLQSIEETLNNTPRKVLGYLTPSEVWAILQTAS